MDEKLTSSLDEKTSEALNEYNIISSDEAPDALDEEGEGDKPLHFDYPAEWRNDIKEKIIICLDINTEMNRPNLKSKDGTEYSYFEVAKNLLIKFLYLASYGQANVPSDRRDEYALLVLCKDDVKMYKKYTSSIEEIAEKIRSLVPRHLYDRADSFDITKIYNVAIESKLVSSHDLSLVITDKPHHITRFLLVYGRSECIPEVVDDQVLNQFSSNPYIFTDVFYLHSNPNDDQAQYMTNTISDTLKHLDSKDGSMFISCGEEITQLHNSMAKFIANPLLRKHKV